MTEEIAGQGETTPTSNVDSGRLRELESQLQEATRTIERLRGTQSSNDRELGRLRTRESELQQQLADIDAARAAALSDLTQERSSIESLNKRLGELSGIEQKVSVAQSEAERMRLAAILAGTTPAISLLVETNALPQAETVDAFKEALERIAAGIGQAASGQARQMLAGTHPDIPGAKPTREALLQEADRLLKAGKFNEAIALNTQALELTE